MSKAKLTIEFKKPVDLCMGSLRDDCGVVIPTSIISSLNSNTVKFCDGWTLTAKKDAIEIQYHNFVLLFCEGRVKEIIINYSGRK